MRDFSAYSELKSVDKQVVEDMKMSSSTEKEIILVSWVHTVPTKGLHNQR